MTRSISTPAWIYGILVHNYTPRWREALWEQRVLPKKATQSTRARARSARSGDYYTYHEAIAPPPVAGTLYIFNLSLAMLKKWQGKNRKEMTLIFSCLVPIILPKWNSREILCHDFMPSLEWAVTSLSRGRKRQDPGKGWRSSPKITTQSSSSRRCMTVRKKYCWDQVKARDIKGSHS